MTRYGIAAGAAALVIASALTGCSSSSGSGSTSSARAATTQRPGATTAAAGSSPGNAAGGITINSFKYSGSMTVRSGQKVTVTNKDSVAHTLTDKKSHLFDTGNIDGGGGTGTFTAPKKPGSYPFGCTYHPEMAGTLIVK
jgi:plastocyanin